MAKEYYNKFLLHQAVKLMETNPEQSRIEFEGYLEKYPNDHYAIVLYISLLVSLQELELAQNIFNNVEKSIRNFDIDLHRHYFESFFFERNLLFTNIKLLSYTGRYREAIDLLNTDSKQNSEFSVFKLYCLKKIGKLKIEKKESTSYIMRQIIDYSEADMRNHILKHLSNSCESDAVFCENFPIDKILDEIKKYIPGDKKILGGLFDNYYYFKYDNCGRNKNKLANFFKIVCFDGTSDIITICPVLIGEDLPYIDLNYLNSNAEPSNVKVMSQIDKFNRRYKR